MSQLQHCDVGQHRPTYDGPCHSQHPNDNSNPHTSWPREPEAPLRDLSLSRYLQDQQQKARLRDSPLVRAITVTEGTNGSRSAVLNGRGGSTAAITATGAPQVGP